MIYFARPIGKAKITKISIRRQEHEELATVKEFWIKTLPEREFMEDKILKGKELNDYLDTLYKPILRNIDRSERNFKSVVIIFSIYSLIIIFGVIFVIWNFFI